MFLVIFMFVMLVSWILAGVAWVLTPDDGVTGGFWTGVFWTSFVVFCIVLFGLSR